MNSKNRIPWIVAASAMLFAMVVLVRNEISPNPTKPYEMSFDERTVIRPVEPEWRPARFTPAVVRTADYSPWTNNDPDNKQMPPSAIITQVPLSQATPETSPTPIPLNIFRGIVLDGNGNPISKAHVRIVSGGKDRAAERSALSSTDGRFAIEGIPSSLLDRVVVEAEGFSVWMLQDIPLPLPDELQIGMNALAGIDAVIVDFTTSGSTPVLFSGEMQASLMQLKPAGDISTNSLGIPEPTLPVDSYVPVRNQDVVVIDGDLRFDNVEPGRYRVAVKSGKKIAESEAIGVAEASRSSTTLVLGMKHTVKGNVVGADTEKPVVEARVGLSPAGSPGAAPDFPDYLSFTDGDGEFVIPEVQPGRFWMVVGAAGYTTRTIENFNILPGAPPENTSVTLTKQEPLITVSVTNSEGRPIPQAPLVLMTSAAESPRTYFGKSDEAGLHRFEQLHPGRYSLSITSPGDRTRQKTVNLELSEGEVRELAVRFGNPVAVTGKVTLGGKSYKGLLSFVLRGAAMADNLVPTDKNGGFTASLEPGEYMVRTPDKPGGSLVTINNTEAQTLKVELP